MEEVEQCREQLPRAPTLGALGDAGAVAEATTKNTEKKLRVNGSMENTKR